MGGANTGTVGAPGAVSVSSADDFLLRDYLGGVQVNDTLSMSALTPTQTAAMLYRSGKKRAAKELLCDQREIYLEFKRTASPCAPRNEWELANGPVRGLTANSLTASAPLSFRANTYRSQADCLTAAYGSGVPLSACSR